MFKSVLVANRGEIAVRIVRTVRAMGIRAVAVASIPDRHSLAVRSADAWVLLEGYSATESYLDIEAIIAAAKAEGCEAIHPGYGFLSERADFAERCAAEGITFVGPPPAVLRGLGDKAAARQLAVANGVPVVPGWDGADDDATLIREAANIGFPVMVKARGGGGGRGMREVHAAGALLGALESARREAQAAFGDPGLLLEKLVLRAHHVEVQVLADTHGNVIHLGERDCSVQRRRQKLIEETPSPVVDDALRAELTGAALRLARAASYLNAGTFEFLVAEPIADGRRPFYFLEVNPRLQVEHPVTEVVTGLDLVELQLRIAAGEPLPLGQDEVKFEGHAIEFRINAEDPWDDFRPSAGRLAHLIEEAGRVDSGFADGDVVPAQYDSLIAKAIFTGPSREEALDDACRGLSGIQISGVRSNVRLHEAIAGEQDFRGGSVDIGWLERNLEEVLQRARTTPREWAAAAAAYGRLCAPGDVWRDAGNGIWLTDGTFIEYAIDEPQGAAGGLIHVAGYSVPYVVENRAARIDVDGRCLCGQPWPWGLGEPMQGAVVSSDRLLRYFRLAPPPRLPRRPRAADGGALAIVAPLSGTVSAVRVAEGEAVETGQVLLLLEAMKMEHRVAATATGTVKHIAVCEGESVREGDVLVEVE